MGGLAFSSGANPLSTPRMPPAVYRHMLNYCHAKLQELFVVVATPIPGPAKKDYGDIDIFLAWERSVVFPSSAVNSLLESLSSPTHNPLQAAARLLNAERCIQEQSKIIVAAIPWPDEIPCEGAEKYVGEPRYIQVDLHLCDSLEHLQWMLFKHAHGDLWNMFGSTIRPYGLTVDEAGLYIRIPEIENLNKKKAKILLTTDPIEILEFLGLEYNHTHWEEPFSSVDELLEYAATCRLFWVRPDPDSAEGNELDRDRLKSNDRRRMSQRSVFRKWIDEFLPACRKSGRFAAQPATRDAVRSEAFARFLGAEHAYQTRLTEWRKERQRQTLWRDVIKASIPEPQPDESENDGEVDLRGKIWRSHAASAFKKIVMLDDYSLGIRPPAPLRDEDGLFDEALVRRFVLDTWRQVGDAASEANDKRYVKKRKEREMEMDAKRQPGGAGGIR
ncbi:hypothetical protein M426DRAFT_319808 [Hypoxylon sp. CI-4A]|nr:hypothetical protein M426DRAFT_319808 [Hypoxylon sp. CI-4A]